MPSNFSDLINVPNLETNFIKGIDLSHHNSTIKDWNSIRNAGIAFAIIKVSDGVNSPDKYASEHATMAQKKGLKIGYYHFAHPDTKSGGNIIADAKAEANDFMSRLKTLPHSDLDFFLDLENWGPAPQNDSSLNPVDYLLWANTFIDELLRAANEPGKSVVIYSRKEYLDRKLPGNHNLGKYKFWISRYINDYNKAIAPVGWNDWYLWQFTETGAFANNMGTFDLNIMRK
ncbi:MAG: glycoside hydrolase family 25 protein [Bacteroidia bacterium]